MEEKLNSVKAFAPATVANVGPGFDIFGLALEGIGDEIEVKKTDKPGIVINEISGYPDLPTDPKLNVAGVAIQALLNEAKHEGGFEIIIKKKVLPGSGLGSSASSSVAAIVAINELLRNPFSKKELLQFAVEGERASSGVAHADNVAPSLFGGFTFVRSYEPLDVVNVDVPEDLCLAIIHPQIEIKTADSKKILRKEISMSAAVKQWGNVAGLIAGLTSKNYDLISRSMEDVVVEPIRSLLIPGYDELKSAALKAGALGCSISGSGPSVFALCRGQDSAQKVSKAFREVYSLLQVEFNIYTSPINKKGAYIIQ